MLSQLSKRCLSGPNIAAIRPRLTNSCNPTTTKSLFFTLLCYGASFSQTPKSLLRFIAELGSSPPIFHVITRNVNIRGLIISVTLKALGSIPCAILVKGE